MVIKHKRIKLRALEKEDLPLLARWAQDWEVGRFFNAYGALPQEETERWYERVLEAQRNRRQFRYAIDDEEGKLIGTVALIHIDWKNRNAELDIGIGEKDHWGKGYGTEAITAILNFAFRELNLHRVGLIVFDFNGRAIRCCEKCGFRHEGRAREALFQDGCYHDVLFMGILKEEFWGV